jgi:hypothetical protein
LLNEKKLECREGRQSILVHLKYFEKLENLFDRVATTRMILKKIV